MTKWIIGCLAASLSVCFYALQNQQQQLAKLNAANYDLQQQATILNQQLRQQALQNEQTNEVLTVFVEQSQELQQQIQIKNHRITRLINENTELKNWAAGALPSDIIELYQR